jgi:hypothetical protein
MRYTVERVILTRRRGDAEEDAEKNQTDQNLRAQRKRRDVGWRHRPGTQVSAYFGVRQDLSARAQVDGHASLRSSRISADPAISGFELLICVLRVFLRVSASPRQECGLLGSGSAELGNGAVP